MKKLGPEMQIISPFIKLLVQMGRLLLFFDLKCHESLNLHEVAVFFPGVFYLSVTFRIDDLRMWFCPQTLALLQVSSMQMTLPGIYDSE